MNFTPPTVTLATVTKTKNRRSGGRGLRIGLGIIAGLIGITAVGYAAGFLITRGDVPRGATVGGVAIGGMSQAAAAETLETAFGQVTSQPVQVHAGDMTATFVPAESGVRPDWKATVAAAGSQSLNPITRVQRFFHTYEVDMVSTADDRLFTPALRRVHDELTREPVNGAVHLDAGKVVTEEPVNGQSVDRDELRHAVTTEWLMPEGVTIKAAVKEPEIRAAAVKAAAEGDAAKAVSKPIIAHGRDHIDGVIPPERMGEVVTFVPDKDALRTDINVEAAQGILAENLTQTERQRRNAEITFGEQRVITPHVDGVTIKWEDTLKDLPARITGDKEREFDVLYEDTPASFTTEMAEKATFDDVIGEFTTEGFSEASGKNIALTAQTVNGAIVAPGDTFSLNGFTGPRGEAQGYVKSGIILNGHADEAVGGGISQFATTLYNAAYFAGMEDVAHTAHSYYISRYPAGREATVYEGAIDLQFKNNSEYPVRIDTQMGEKSVTVRLMGVKTVNVESVNGGRWAQTQPQTIELGGDKCAPSAGAPGFTTSDTRIIKDLSGREISRQEQTTVYDPQPIVRCKK